MFDERRLVLHGVGISRTFVHSPDKVFHGRRWVDGEKFGVFPSGSPQAFEGMLTPMGGVMITGTL